MRAISKTSTATTTTTLAPMATLTKIGNTNNTHFHSSPWHTPIPYLFGGLAAMLGLIAFALLMLACSYYWKLFLQLQNRQQNGDNNNNNNVGDLEKECDETQRNEPFKAYEEKVLVIMAGNEKPTFLATPVFPNYGKQLVCQDCGSKIEDFEVSDNNVSEKDIINKDNVVVHVDAAAAATTPAQEDQDSQQNQEQEENQ